MRRNWLDFCGQGDIYRIAGWESVMEKIKILHIYKSFNVYNGLIEILTILARNLDQSRYELAVGVYEHRESDFSREFQRLGGTILCMDVPGGMKNEVKQYTALVKLFREYKPHIVQTHVLKANLYGTLAAKQSGVPGVIATEMTLKDTAPSPVKRLRDRAIQPLVGMMLKHVDRYVVTSKYIRDEWSAGRSDPAFEVVYPPFNLEKYSRVKRKKKKSAGKDVCFVGRLSEEKGLPYLLDTMSNVHARVPDVRLTLVGTGPLEEGLKKQVDSLGLNEMVRFAGYAPNSFEALAEADMFVLPSRTEGCPIVILEAMASALPVVATAVGGSVELVRDGETGYLVPYGDHERLGESLITLLTDKPLAEKLGRNGQRLAFQDFHPEKFTRSLESLYEEIVRLKVERNGIAVGSTIGRENPGE